MSQGLSWLKICLRDKNIQLKRRRVHDRTAIYINRKVNIVELAQSLGNISEACRNLGVSGSHYYDIKSAITEEGINADIKLTFESVTVKA